MTESIDAIDAFIADHLSDFSLPYTEENLPNAVKGEKARRRFLDLQNLVLRTHAADLEKGGNHLYCPRSADDYFQSLKELGDGGFGQVDHVWSRLSLKDYARKRIPRGRSFKRDKINIANFEKELKTLKLLRHRHLVRLIGCVLFRALSSPLRPC
jgi:serine/threonine protein kinase